MLRTLISKFIVTISIIIVGCNLYSQPCPQGSIDFKSQSQLDSFKLLYPDCEEINGNVRIYSELDTIKNLSALSKIKVIAGNLGIYQNPGLEGLTGLENLTTIKGYLAIGNNANLKSLNALIHVTEISRILEIYSNPELLVLNGLDNINLELTDKLVITNNSNLSFCHIRSVCQHLKYYGLFEIYGNGPDCAYMENVYQNCSFPTDTLEVYEEECLEDGFENWY